MSEYQYYEFQSIDRPLTEDEQAEIRKLSSRVVLTSTNAAFTYNFGDFRGRPEKVLEQYFDVMLYVANWGSRRLMFRFPKSLVDLKHVRAYEVEDIIEFNWTDKYVILDISFNELDLSFWVEGEGHLSSLARLRDDLLRQDYRLLYLAWLKAVSLGEASESEVEPPVPPGLGSLSAALRTFIDLVELDSHLVSAASKASPSWEPLSEEKLYRAIAQLSHSECADYVRRLLQGEPQLAMALRTRLQQLAGVRQTIPTGQRTVEELLANAEEERQMEEAARAREAERKRRAEVEALAKREDGAWEEVQVLLKKYTAQNYEQAVQLISSLREVAVYKKTETLFQARLNGIYERYRTRHSLLDRLRAAGLHPGGS